MSKALQWVIGIGVVVMVAVFAFASIAPLFLARTTAVRMPMMAGPAAGMPFFMGLLFGAGRFGFRPPFFGLFQLASCLWPLLLVGLIVWAFTALAARPAPTASVPPVMPAPAPAGPALCPNCGQPLQAGWRHCPSCGQAVNQ